MGKRFRLHPASRHLLDMIVADRGRRV